MSQVKKFIAVLVGVLAIAALPSSALAVNASLAAQTVPGHPWPQADCNDNWGVINGNQIWGCVAYNVNTAGQPGTGTLVDYIDSTRSFVRVYYYKYTWAGNYHCHTTVIAHDPFSYQYNTYAIEYRARGC